MKRYLVITCSVLAFLLFCSKSCEKPENENAARDEIAFKATLDSINNSFQSDHLSEQTLRAFETKAKQKLADFADYLQIYTDDSLDESFKDHTRQMILDLFISDSVHIKIRISNEEKENNLTLKEFCKMDFPSGKNSMEFIFDSIDLSEPLHSVNKITYIGGLKFSQRYELPSPPSSEVYYQVNKEVDIIAARVRKKFGSDTLKIWQVYLGDIR